MGIQYSVYLQCFQCSQQLVFAARRPPPMLLCSSGQTDYAVLKAAPASSALYGFAFPRTASDPPAVYVTLTASNGTVLANVSAATAASGSGSVCDASW